MPDKHCFPLALFCLLLPSSLLRGAIFTIPNGDVAALKNAIVTASTNGEGDAILLAPNGTYTLTAIDNMTNGATGLPVIHDDIAGDSSELFINGQGATLQRSSGATVPGFRILQIAGANVSIANLTITNGEGNPTTYDREGSPVHSSDYGGGAILNIGGRLELDNCFIHTNGATGFAPKASNVSDGAAGGPGRGGAVYSQGRLVMGDCTLSSNIAFGGRGADTSAAGATGGTGGNGEGGGIYCDGAFSAQGSTFRTSSATGGAGGNAPSNRAGDAAGGSGKGGNGGVANGGAVFNVNSPTTPFFRTCTFDSNIAYGGARGIGGQGQGLLGNVHGGGLYTDKATIFDSSFINNSTTGNYQYGGGMWFTGNSLTVHRCLFQNNSTEFDGGAAYVVAGSSANVTIEDSTFDSNSVDHSGGAIELFTSGPTTISGCLFSGNNAGYGGAIACVPNNSFNVVNTTFSANAASYGGGMYLGNTAATLAVTNATFANNTATQTNGGGGICAVEGSGSVKVVNTLFKAGNPGQNLVGNAGSITSGGHNISSDAAGGDGNTGPGGYLNGPLDIRNTDPDFATTSPVDNGGPTFTFDLKVTSPAINHGDDGAAPERDQRGAFRTGTCDVGAVEFNGGLVMVRLIYFSGGIPTVYADVVQGHTYRLQRKSALTDSVWQTVEDEIATDSEMNFPDSTVGNLTKAFYRIVCIH